MKTKALFFYILLVFSLCLFCFNYAEAKYEEFDTYFGKVVVGLDRQEAMEKFGAPASAGKDIWYYSSPKEFYIYFKAPYLSLQLYPQSSKTYVGMPLEFKVFSSSFNYSNIEDITSKAELIENEPGSFIIKKTGVIIPKRSGEYQLLAMYRDAFSNPSYITVAEPEEEGEEIPVVNLTEGSNTCHVVKPDQLLDMEVLPYQPLILPGTKLKFTALGLFLAFPSCGVVSSEVRDISRDSVWFVEGDKKSVKVENNEIYFGSEGRYKVFCTYGDKQSVACEVEVKEQPMPFKQTLKHISVMPDFIILPLDRKAKIKAFGTYYNNEVRDITGRAGWEIKDRRILNMQEKGSFLPKSKGSTELYAELDRMQSLPVKVIVAAAGLSSSVTSINDPRKKDEPNDTISDVNNDIEKLSRELFRESKKLVRIVIDPDYLKLPFGEERKLAAFGIYNDRSREDITILGDWVSFEPKIANVTKGMVSTGSPGEVKVYMEYAGVKSELVSIIVEGPKLASIFLSPENSRIRMDESLMLKAEGYFSDSSRKDITSSVDWRIDKPNTVRITKGKVIALRSGELKAYAELSGIQSLPANIRVVFSLRWLIGLFLRGILFLILSVISGFCVLYFLVERKKKRLVSLYNDPRKFIIGLYENLKNILTVFGFKYEGVIPPLSYAALVEEKYYIKDNIFLKFTLKFEEAKYSQHPVELEDADSTIEVYNYFLKALSSIYNKRSLFFKYCLTLLHLVPFYIDKTKN